MPLEAAERRRGSWPLVLALLVAFLGCFWFQRERSAFLAIEAERGVAAAIAGAHGITIADAMALRDLIGVGVPRARWDGAAATFAAERRRIGDAFAALAVVEGANAAALAAAVGGGDVAAAWQRFRAERAALPGLRFLAMRERFAGRTAARD